MRVRMVLYPEPKIMVPEKKSKHGEDGATDSFDKHVKCGYSRALDHTSCYNASKSNGTVVA